MMINYRESITLLKCGSLIKNENEKMKFESLLGDFLSPKISSFENEEFYLVIKKDVAYSLMKIINETDDTYNDLKKIREIKIEDRMSSHLDSDDIIPISLSLNEISELSKLATDRKNKNINNKEINNRIELDMAELEKLSNELKKENIFPIPNVTMKNVFKIIKNNKLTSVDDELFKKIESNLLIHSEKNKYKIN